MNATFSLNGGSIEPVIHDAILDVRHYFDAERNHKSTYAIVDQSCVILFTTTRRMDINPWLRSRGFETVSLNNTSTQWSVQTERIDGGAK